VIIDSLLIVDWRLSIEGGNELVRAGGPACTSQPVAVGPINNRRSPINNESTIKDRQITNCR
jgi:hypothetical protein